MRRTIPVLFLFTGMLLCLTGCTDKQEALPSQTMETAPHDTEQPENSIVPGEETCTPDNTEESNAVLEAPVSGSIPADSKAGESEPTEPTSEASSAKPHSPNPEVPTEPAQAQPSPTQTELPAESAPASPEPAVLPETEPPTESPVPVTPQETEPEPTPEPETETPSFDIGYWISFAQSYAGGVGLTLNPEAVYCWDTPITAGSHCLYLERDIRDRLDRYGRDSEITSVWIWAEARSDGSYDFYIGYA